MNNINKIKLQILPILKEADVSHSFIFGSYAKKQQKKNSDIDLIVEFNKQKTLLDLITLKLELEKKTGIEVDVLTSDSIHPNIRELIQKEKMEIIIGS